MKYTFTRREWKKWIYYYKLAFGPGGMSRGFYRCDYTGEAIGRTFMSENILMVGMLMLLSNKLHMDRKRTIMNLTFKATGSEICI